uniref:Tyrosine--tRNA ligase, cytoplasmic n=1 Tax=Timema monikensis TaxID=170555 RepID=A0A7R9E7L1_9NEOP|nr:unnamed protein product [Timema monikensis]
MANEKQVSMASEQTHAVAEEIVTLTSSSVSAPCAKLTRSDDVWCVDSGATTHMCRDKNSFLELTPTVSQKVRHTMASPHTHLQKLDEHFLDNSFVEGERLSRGDFLLHQVLMSAPATFRERPNILRWFRHISTHPRELADALPDTGVAFEELKLQVELWSQQQSDGNVKLTWEPSRDQVWEHKSRMIRHNLKEVLGEDRMEDILKEGRGLRIYWGTATTGRIHIGYFVPMAKIADYLKAGCEVTILFADLHAYLDNMKAPWELLKLRARYYEVIIKTIMLSLGISIDRLKFVLGSDYQLSKEYTLDVYRLSSIITQHDAKKAGAEVVKQVDHPLLSGLLYPGLQALDEEHLHVDAQFGVPGLSGGKMSASEEDSKIDLLDPPHVVKRKIKKAFCEPKNITDNGLLSIVEYVIFPLCCPPKGGLLVTLDSGKKTKTYTSVRDLESDFAAGDVHPGELKDMVEHYLNILLVPIRAAFTSADKRDLVNRAYPKTYKGGVDELKPWRLDLCVGTIIKAENHPDSSGYLILHLNDGSLERRVGVVPQDSFTELIDLLGRPVILLRNIAPTKTLGIQVTALILYAQNFLKETR